MFTQEFMSEISTGTPVVRTMNVLLGILIFAIAVWIGCHVAGELFAAL